MSNDITAIYLHNQTYVNAWSKGIYKGLIVSLFIVKNIIPNHIVGFINLHNIQETFFKTKKLFKKLELKRSLTRHLCGVSKT